MMRSLAFPSAGSSRQPPVQQRGKTGPDPVFGSVSEKKVINEIRTLLQA